MRQRGGSVPSGMGTVSNPASPGVGIPVLIAVRHSLVSSALAALLANAAEVRIRGTAGTVAELESSLDDPAAASPFVLLLDAEFDGADHTPQLIARLSVLRPDMRVVICTGETAPSRIAAAISSGIAALVELSASPEELIATIVAAGTRRGDTTLLPRGQMFRLLNRGTSPLTEREADALRAVRSGLSTEEIARSLFLSAGTVRNLLSSAIQKTHARNRYLAAEAAVDRGWLEPGVHAA